MCELLKMWLNFLLLLNIFSTLAASTATTSKPNENVTSTNSTKAPVAFYEVKNPVLMAEGGVIDDKTSSFTLKKHNENISKDLIKESSSVSSVPKVVPRKGVGNYMVKEEKDDLKTDKLPVQVTISPSFVPPKSDNKSKSDGTTQKVSTTKKPPIRKPMILSAEALANMEKVLKPSPDTSKSTDESIALPVKYEYLSKKNSHPEMIMPLVITILLIPMFAVVGYLVFRRGRDAWKNRHYKRMDFLLDGMYND